FREGDVEQLLDDLRAGVTDLAICGLPAAGRWEGLEEPEKLWDNVPTVALAARNHRDWGLREGKKRKQANPNGTAQVEVSELDNRTLCMLETDRLERMPTLRVPPRESDRILVDRYASVVALAQAGSCLGLIPILGPVDRAAAEQQNLLVY